MLIRPFVAALALRPLFFFGTSFFNPSLVGSCGESFLTSLSVSFIFFIMTLCGPAVFSTGAHGFVI